MGNSYSIGIDLGRSHFGYAWYISKDDNGLSAFKDDQIFTFKQPSYFITKEVRGREEKEFGYDALYKIQFDVNEEVKEIGTIKTQDLKCFEREFDTTQPCDIPFTKFAIENIDYQILRRLQTPVQTKDCVVTLVLPSNTTTQGREKLKQTAKRSYRFKEVRIITDVVAASIGICDKYFSLFEKDRNHPIKSNHVYCVVNFGGEHTSACIFEVHCNYFTCKKTLHILDERLFNISGKQMDDFIKNEIYRAIGILENDITEWNGYDLFLQEIRSLKTINLKSTWTHTPIRLHGLGTYRPEIMEKIPNDHCDGFYTKENDMFVPHQVVKDAIAEFNTQIAEIQQYANGKAFTVFLVGGLAKLFYDNGMNGRYVDKVILPDSPQAYSLIGAARYGADIYCVT